MGQDSFKLGVILLTILVGLTLSNEHQKYFYHLDGQEISPNVQLRLKRDTSEAENTPTTKPVTQETSTTVQTSSVASNPAASIPSSTENQSENPSKPRGWQPPPDNDSAFLENVDLKSDKINATIESHLKEENLTASNEDHYKYYNSTFVPFEGNWIDLEEWNKTIHPGIVNQHSMLSKSYRRAATIALKFKFPFYGHYVENITIATGGFLYTGEYVHSWLAATQYIAPLMANFDTSQEESATVKYADNGTTLVVEWANVYLQGGDGTHLEGPFTFQAILHQKGDIIFAYKSIPVSISMITDDEHPVKVGLSDAYIIERTIFFVRRKTIYEYHRVNMKGKKIESQTAIYLQALPRCNTKTTCRDCLSLTVHDDGRDIQCMWCDKAKLCSDGFDRNKQNWLKNCEKRNSYISGELENCDVKHRDIHDYHNPSYTTDNSDDRHNVDQHDREEIGQNEDHEHFKDSKNKVHHTGVALLTIVMILIITICGWCLYAYFFPHTCSGQLLIKYRPSRWHWRRGEARYTAASIHM